MFRAAFSVKMGEHVKTQYEALVTIQSLSASFLKENCTLQMNEPLICTCTPMFAMALAVIC